MSNERNRCSQIISQACLYNSTNYKDFLQQARNASTIILLHFLKLISLGTTDAIFTNSYPSKNGYLGPSSRREKGEYSQRSCQLSLKPPTCCRHATSNFFFKLINTLVKMCSLSSLHLPDIFFTWFKLEAWINSALKDFMCRMITTWNGNILCQKGTNSSHSGIYWGKKDYNMNLNVVESLLQRCFLTMFSDKSVHP